jgi:tRNA1Val (adenine37-N6)-methyltransferase
MKVGTDGVLLGAWARLPQNEGKISSPNVLDVGTGTGLIALMLAQRFPDTKIEGIDIDEASLEQAKENVENSIFNAQITLKKQDFSNLDSFSNQYHLIISNPPFYTEETLGGNPARDRARHATSLPFEILVSNVAKLLTENGLFSVIIPHQSAADFISICVANRLYLTRRLNIRSTERKNFNRVLLEFSTSIQPAETNTLTLYDANNNRSPEYAQLTKDFYL